MTLYVFMLLHVHMKDFINENCLIGYLYTCNYFFLAEDKSAMPMLFLKVCKDCCNS